MARAVRFYEVILGLPDRSELICGNSRASALTDTLYWQRVLLYHRFEAQICDPLNNSCGNATKPLMVTCEV